MLLASQRAMLSGSCAGKADSGVGEPTGFHTQSSVPIPYRGLWVQLHHFFLFTCLPSMRESCVSSWWLSWTGMRASSIVLDTSRDGAPRISSSARLLLSELQVLVVSSPVREEAVAGQAPSVD